MDPVGGGAESSGGHSGRSVDHSGNSGNDYAGGRNNKKRRSKVDGAASALLTLNRNMPSPAQTPEPAPPFSSTAQLTATGSPQPPEGRHSGPEKKRSSNSSPCDTIAAGRPGSLLGKPSRAHASVSAPPKPMQQSPPYNQHQPYASAAAANMAVAAAFPMNMFMMPQAGSWPGMMPQAGMMHPGLMANPWMMGPAAAMANPFAHHVFQPQGGALPGPAAARASRDTRPRPKHPNSSSPLRPSSPLPVDPMPVLCVQKWSTSQVADWLCSIGCEDLVGPCSSQDVDGMALKAMYRTGSNGMGGLHSLLRSEFPAARSGQRLRLVEGLVSLFTQPQVLPQNGGATVS